MRKGGREGGREEGEMAVLFELTQDLLRKVRKERGRNGVSEERREGRRKGGGRDGCSL